MTMTVDRQAEPVAERVLTEELERELLKHPGKWVAMTRDRILAIGTDSAIVYRTAIEAGTPDPILYRVPEAGAAYFF